MSLILSYAKPFVSSLHNILSFYISSSLSSSANTIKGIKSPTMHNYIINFTCGKCDNKILRSFTKHAYHKGIVIIQCDKCKGNHLIADNLGWFTDSNNSKVIHKENIEDILKAKKEKYIKHNLAELIEYIKKDYKL